MLRLISGTVCVLPSDAFVAWAEETLSKYLLTVNLEYCCFTNLVRIRVLVLKCIYILGMWACKNVKADNEIWGANNCKYWGCGFPRINATWFGNRFHLQNHSSHPGCLLTLYPVLHSGYHLPNYTVLQPTSPPPPPTKLHSVASRVPPKNYTLSLPPTKLVSHPGYLLKKLVSQPRYHLPNYTVTSQVPPTKLHSVTTQVLYHLPNYTDTSQVPPTKLHSVTTELPPTKLHCHIPDTNYQTTLSHPRISMVESVWGNFHFCEVFFHVLL